MRAVGGLGLEQRESEVAVMLSFESASRLMRRLENRRYVTPTFLSAGFGVEKRRYTTNKLTATLQEIWMNVPGRGSID